MAVETSCSEIISYYRDKTVFISGGSGFVGRILVEHLIRKCGVKKIFMLVRAKKGVEPKERKHNIFNVPLFEKLRSLKPNFMDCIEFVNGDMAEVGLGLDETSKKFLINQVQIVFNSAATVNLTANLKVSTEINVRGTREMCRLCAKFEKLEAFVHVSTAYAHSVRDEIGETIYDVPIQPDDLIRIAESLSAEKIDSISNNLLCGWPNTYTFTKAAAENILKNFEERMSICIVRPGLVFPTRNDPIDGWVDNTYGPIGFFSGMASGVLRVTNTNPEAKTELVPADMLVSLLIAAGQRTGKQSVNSGITVYNVVTDPENPVTYGQVNNTSLELYQSCPPSYAMWYITLTLFKSRLMFLVTMFWAHLVPAIIFDGFRLLTRRRPKAVKLYRKIHAFMDSVSFVSRRSWDFDVKNSRKLAESLNEFDRKYFDFDMSKSNLDWREMVRTATNGTSQYLLKEELYNSTAQAKRKFFLLYICHRIVQCIYIMVGYYLLKLTISIIMFLYSALVEASRYALCDVA